MAVADCYTTVSDIHPVDETTYVLSETAPAKTDKKSSTFPTISLRSLLTGTTNSLVILSVTLGLRLRIELSESRID